MPSRRTWLRLISCLIVLIAALAVYAYLSLNRLLEREQVEHADWQGVSLSSQGIALDQLTLRHPSAAIKLHGIHLPWPGFSFAPPFWQQVHIAQVQLNLPAASAPTSSPSAALQLEQLTALMAWLPQQLDIQTLQVELPCADKRCTLLGELHLLKHATSAATQLDVQLRLQHQQDHLHWQAQLDHTLAATTLELSLAINQQPQLRLSNQLTRGTAGLDWQGELTADLQQGAVLQHWLSQWLPDALTDQQIPAQPASLQARWQLQLPSAPLNLSQLLQASGQLSAQVNLAEPWPIPTLGHLQGSLTVSAHTQGEQWLADHLSADLNLSHIAQERVSSLAAEFQPHSLQLNIQAAETPDTLNEQLVGRSLPLRMHLSGDGPSPFTLAGTVVLASGLPWAVQLVDGKFTAQSADLHRAAWHTSALNAHLHLDGYLDAQALSLQLTQDSQLNLQHLHIDDLRAQNLQINGAGLHINSNLQTDGPLDWQVQGPIRLISQLEHEHLLPQRWYWQGPVDYRQQQLSLSGTLHNDADLRLKLQVQHNSTQGLSLQAQLIEVFLRGGNPLQGSFSAWPALLTLSNGRLNGNARLSLASGQQWPTANITLTGQGLGGIYDRSTLEGLSSEVQLQIDGQQLRLDLLNLRVAQINSGIALGPLELSARYSAQLQAPTRGQLQVKQATARVMGGELHVAPGLWSLNGEPIRLPLQVQGLELEQLFILYPTEGLAGAGTLDGFLPLQVSPQGISIEQGQLQARQPGGRLQFDSARIRALGRSNPTMQLVTQSLEDFRFTTLSSQVDYDQQGKLNLALRLEGQNPAIEQGRPIHFNINLEEDIPTLLASLQLTDKVSDIIRQRVQQRMLQRNAQPAPSEP